MGCGLLIKSCLGLSVFVIQGGVPLRGAEAGLCAAIRARRLPTAQAGAGFPLQSLTHASTEVIVTPKIKCAMMMLKKKLPSNILLKLPSLNS